MIYLKQKRLAQKQIRGGSYVLGWEDGGWWWQGRDRMSFGEFLDFIGPFITFVLLVLFVAVAVLLIKTIHTAITQRKEFKENVKESFKSPAKVLFNVAMLALLTFFLSILGIFGTHTIPARWISLGIAGVIFAGFLLRAVIRRCRKRRNV